MLEEILPYLAGPPFANFYMNLFTYSNLNIVMCSEAQTPANQHMFNDDNEWQKATKALKKVCKSIKCAFLTRHRIYPREPFTLPNIFSVGYYLDE